MNSPEHSGYSADFADSGNFARPANPGSPVNAGNSGYSANSGNPGSPADPENSARGTAFSPEMLMFAADIGNSSVRFGVADSTGNLLFRSRVCTSEARSADEYAVLFDSLLRMHGIGKQAVTGAILSSVVPGMTHRVADAVRLVFGVSAMIVGKGLHTGFPIRTDSPAEVGADLIANAAAVLEKFGAPAIILDFGTATTLSVIDASRAFVGGCILPGVAVSLSAMRDSAAQLPGVALENTPPVLGKNTADSMRSGLIFGSAAAADGMIDRLARETGISPDRGHLIATGGLAPLIVPHLSHAATLCPDLTLEGLCVLYRRNLR